jgi:hypothetical protein
VRKWTRKAVYLTFVALALSGCASFNHYVSETAWPFGNPNAPTGSSETMQRALGKATMVQPLQTQSGNIWPDVSKPPPTIEDIEKSMDLPLGQGYAPPTASPGQNYGVPVRGHVEPEAVPGDSEFTTPNGTNATPVPTP